MKDLVRLFAPMEITILSNINYLENNLFSDAETKYGYIYFNGQSKSRVILKPIM